jgi:uncharacterized membrane protein
MLVYFIHHIATRMQVSHITAAVARETLDEIHRQHDEHSERAGRPGVGGLPDAAGAVVAARKSGYLQYVQIAALVERAHHHDAVIRVKVAPGAWVQRHAPLFEVWGVGAENIGDELRELVSVGDERVVFQDVAFGVQQLVDIAVKALSPGINDPTTARNALHRIVEILVAAGRAELMPAEHHDDSGRLRLYAPRADLAQLLRTAFEEIQHFSRGIPAISRSLHEALDMIESTVDPAQRPTVAAACEQLRSGSWSEKPTER